MLYRVIVVASFFITACVLSAQQQPSAEENANHANKAKQYDATQSDKTIGIQSDPNNKPSQNIDTKYSQNAQYTPEWISDLNAASTGVMAFFTIVLAILVGYQLVAYRRKERAWIMMDIHHIHGTQLPPMVFPAQNTFRFRMDMKNFGETPATILFAQHDGRVIRREEKLPRRPPYLEKELPEIKNEPIAPKGGTPIYSEFGRSEMDAINSGLATLYIFGRVIYRDIFDKRHETRYCFRYYPVLADRSDVHVGFFPEGPLDYERLT
jgi:hypothetical protein